MLEQSRRKLDGTTVRVLDDEIKLISFKEITNEDLAAVGRIRPVAAKHFAEKATQIQNLTQGYQSGIGADPEVRQHISSKKLAQIFVELMDVDQYGLFDPYVRITEQVESQRMVNAAQEELAVEQGTPAGIAEDDFDPDMEDQLLEELDAEEEDVIEQ